VERADLGEDEIRRRLATHYIPFDGLAVGGYDSQDADARSEAVRRDYEEFLFRRAELLLEPIASLCEGRRPAPVGL
jgi:hypothetical protein